MVPMLILSSCRSLGPPLVKEDPLDPIIEAMLAPDPGLDGEPILTVSEHCVAMCSPETFPPSFALYSGGTVVATTRFERGDRVTYTVEGFQLDDDDLRNLAQMIVDAGLSEGDAHKVGDILGEDGRDALFETTINGVRTFIHAPWFGRQPEQSGLIALVDELTNLTAGDGHEVEIRWWVYAVQPLTGVTCFDVDPVRMEELFKKLINLPPHTSLSFEIGGTVYSASDIRPLLPHDRSCRDALDRLARFDVFDRGLGI